MHALARYASLCQENNLVPIVEPEVLINGSHSIDKCDAVTTQTLHVLFNELREMNVFLPGTILKLAWLYLDKKMTQEQIRK